MIVRGDLSMDFFDKSKHRALAEKLINELPNGNVTDHLAIRRISKITIVPHLPKHEVARLYPKKNGEFHVSLSRDQGCQNSDATLEELLLSVGHEIGHTYLFCLVKIQTKTNKWVVRLLRQYFSCNDAGYMLFFEE